MRKLYGYIFIVTKFLDYVHVIVLLSALRTNPITHHTVMCLLMDGAFSREKGWYQPNHTTYCMVGTCLRRRPATVVSTMLEHRRAH